MTKTYQDIYYDSPDGLKLYARDYAPESDKPVLLCMHGLTRNSADFHDLALRFGAKFRVITVDQRGRGKSQHDPDSLNYRADMYCEDMFALIDKLKLSNIVAVGTSMGGIMTMMMASMKPGIFKAAIMNDIGPEIDVAGLERIKGYVGGAGPFKTWQHAADALKAQGPDVFPDYKDDDWMNFAKRTCIQATSGLIEFNYDPAISEPFKNDDTVAAPVDMWPLFMSLTSIPLLVVRGALSDLLSKETADKMIAAHPNAILSEISNTGHAPMLDEDESVLAIGAFLEALS
ncbi:MAG: alpha/beta fold hydrolase [Alphaproteobacteria bacterium]